MSATADLEAVMSNAIVAAILAAYASTNIASNKVGSLTVSTYKMFSGAAASDKMLWPSTTHSSVVSTSIIRSAPVGNGNAFA